MEGQIIKEACDGVQLLAAVRTILRVSEIALEAFKIHGDKNGMTDWMTGRKDACLNILQIAGV